MDDNKKNDAMTIKDENISLYWIDDEGDESDLPEEERQEIEAFNEKFEQSILKPELAKRLRICECQMGRIMERSATKAKLLGVKPSMMVEQEDIDTIQFGVIAEAKNHKFDKIRMIVHQCKKCGDMHFWGDLEPVMRMFAVAFNNYINDTERFEATFGEEKPEFMIEDVETGEMQPANDLGEALFGKSDSNLGLEDIKDKPDPSKNKVINLSDTVRAQDSIDTE